MNPTKPYTVEYSMSPHSQLPQPSAPAATAASNAYVTSENPNRETSTHNNNNMMNHERACHETPSAATMSASASSRTDSDEGPARFGSPSPQAKTAAAAAAAALLAPPPSPLLPSWADPAQRRPNGGANVGANVGANGGAGGAPRPQQQSQQLQQRQQQQQSQRGGGAYHRVESDAMMPLSKGLPHPPPPAMTDTLSFHASLADALSASLARVAQAGRGHGQGQGQERRGEEAFEVLPTPPISEMASTEVVEDYDEGSDRKPSGASGSGGGPSSPSSSSSSSAAKDRSATGLPSEGPGPPDNGGGGGGAQNGRGSSSVNSSDASKDGGGGGRAVGGSKKKQSGSSSSTSGGSGEETGGNSSSSRGGRNGNGGGTSSSGSGSGSGSGRGGSSSGGPAVVTATTNTTTAGSGGTSSSGEDRFSSGQEKTAREEEMDDDDMEGGIAGPSASDGSSGAVEAHKAGKAKTREHWGAGERAAARKGEAYLGALPASDAAELSAVDDLSGPLLRHHHHRQRRPQKRQRFTLHEHGVVVIEPSAGGANDDASALLPPATEDKADIGAVDADREQQPLIVASARLVVPPPPPPSAAETSSVTDVGSKISKVNEKEALSQAAAAAAKTVPPGVVPPPFAGAPPSPSDQDSSCAEGGAAARGPSSPPSSSPKHMSVSEEGLPMPPTSHRSYSKAKPARPAALELPPENEPATSSSALRRKVSGLSDAVGPARGLLHRGPPSSSDSLGSATEKTGGSSSGSDGGYAASSSSNTNFGTEQSTCSSPSVSSSESGGEAAGKKRKLPQSSRSSSSLTSARADRQGGGAEGAREPKIRRTASSSSSSSSDLADFSSGVSGIDGAPVPFAFRSSSRSALSSFLSSSDDGSSDGDDRKPPATMIVSSAAAPSKGTPPGSAGVSRKAAAKPEVRHSGHKRSRAEPEAPPSPAAVAAAPRARHHHRRAVRRPERSSSAAGAAGGSSSGSIPTGSASELLAALAAASSSTSRCGAPLPGGSSTGGGAAGGASLRAAVGMTALEQSLQWRIERAGSQQQQQQQRRRRRDRQRSYKTAHEDPSAASSMKVAAASSLSSRPRSKSGGPVSSPCKTDWTASYQAASAPMFEKIPIYCVGVDVLASCLSYLEPVEVHSVLTMPLSHAWRSTFTIPQDLWKVLCLSEPFYAKLDEDGAGSSDDSLCSFPICNDLEVKHLFGRYRLLYTSFIRCMRYLARIKDDAINGRSPSAIDDGASGLSHHPFNGNASLKDFFSKARGIMRKNRRRTGASESSSSLVSSGASSGSGSRRLNDGDGNKDVARAAPAGGAIGVMDDGSSVESGSRARKRRKGKGRARQQKYGHSKLTERLLGPARQAGVAGHVELPWSCAIYSVVNWMVAFADVEGIQVMCLKVLPFLLEDENQRTTAQRAGLTDIVLRGMVLFPDSVQLHTAAFHTLVLLARPLGGKEGMLFHSAMVNASGIFNIGSSTGKNGIAVMLDSMRRFSHDEVLQAMSCWSMVNIALIPTQKTMLVKLGGISVAANAMMQHPYNAEVQFRALFALINLVIPTENLAEDSPEVAAMQEQLGDVSETTEREMLDENVGQIANLVVVAMKNFCSSEAILNRACLVLHNLSLNEDYHRTLLWTPNCYQMLEWCIGNYRHDQVLQQSAGGTLQRLQMTLAGDNDLRMRFLESIRAQQQSSLEQARREAMYMHDQQEERNQA